MAFNNDDVDFDAEDTCDIKFAPGIHFDPTDEELMIRYLFPKLGNPKLRLHAMFEVDVYAHHPSDLFEMWRKRFGRKEKNTFFVSPRTRKSKTAKRPDRSTRGRIHGHWRHVTRDDVKKSSGGETIGTRNTLDFYEGVHVKGSTKTQWKFCEYVRKGSDKKFKDMVLYKLYKAKRGKPNENGEDDSEEEEEDESEYEEFYRRCAQVSYHSFHHSTQTQLQQQHSHDDDGDLNVEDYLIDDCDLIVRDCLIDGPPQPQPNSFIRTINNDLTLSKPPIS